MGRKWANIVKQKSANDKLRGQIYTKILMEVTSAAKVGGEDPGTNFLLKVALEKCKKNNVPKDNIDRAISKGCGNLDDGYNDITYEGYGPNGVAIFVEASTNNPTRTIANVRVHFKKAGGAVGTTGSLQFVFNRRAVFEIPQGALDEDDFTMEMIELGAEDIELEDGFFSITGPMEIFGSVSKKLEELNVAPEEAALEQVPLTFKEVDDETYLTIMKLVDSLEEDEDVLKVYHNIEFDERFANL
ncbi:transcriptional regulator [Halobacteriovorax marinus]|uniref:Probable transcriptional regulatory protein A9Q84_00655 n=1 Tax=Halobacteriovorax marinus TaxID=97084 RepID=A0A1Y5FBQ6_9BACT|nr:transcriptional regulator [Halobacteriovorax marinus]